MKSSTYTSNMLASIKLAKSSLINAKFIYGFFTRDETLVEGLRPINKNNSPDRILSQLKKSPRYVTISMSPPITNAKKSTLLSDIKLVRENINIVYSAEDVGNTSATTILVQDTGLLDRVYRTIKRSADLRGITGNLTDVSLKLGDVFGKAIDRALLQELTSRFSEAGANFISDSTRIGTGKFGQVRSTITSYTASDKFVLDLIKSGEATCSPGPVSSIALLSDNLAPIQESARSEVQAISSNDYITIFEPVHMRESTDKEFVDGTELIATLIYRKETLSSGNEITRLLDVLASDSTTYNDHEVKLGATYDYWVHSVYRITTHSISVNTGQVVVAKVLFQSEASQAYTVRTADDVPPPPPTDFGLRWDYMTKKLILSWTFPPTSQRDIKYFQIFRRSSINEPFTMLMEYDFNDSLALPIRYENILLGNTQKQSSPMTMYFDTDFKKDSDYIYAVACVDARGFVSNYSQQLRATFDIIRNKLVIELISPGNAPRPYPNVFLRGDIFLDSIVVKGKRRFKVYFDPEYLKLVDRTNNNMGLFHIENEGRYNISIIDVDRAENLNIPLTIKDLRKPA